MSEKEFMGDLTAGRNSRAKTQSGKHLVGIVVLHNLPHGLDGSHILVGTPAWVLVVQTLRALWVPIGSGEVNCYCEVHLCSSLDVVKERGNCLNCYTVQRNCS